MNSTTRALLIIFVGLFISINNSVAQTDSSNIVIYDVVHLSNKGGIIQGTIQSHNATTGILVFKDKYGRVYTFNSDQYDYYEEDQVFVDKKKKRAQKKKDQVINPRKETEFEIALGFTQNMINVDQEFTPNDTYDFAYGQAFELPISLRVSAGKYLDRRNYLGLNAEVGLFGEIDLVKFGARYTYQYDANKGNVAFYIPVEVNYQRIGITTLFDAVDSIVGDVTYNTRREFSGTLNAVSVGFGQGLAFILPNKKSFALELFLHKSLFMKSKLESEEGFELPNVNYGTAGARLSLTFNI